MGVSWLTGMALSMHVDIKVLASTQPCCHWRIASSYSAARPTPGNKDHQDWWSPWIFISMRETKHSCCIDEMAKISVSACGEVFLSSSRRRRKCWTWM